MDTSERADTQNADLFPDGHQQQVRSEKPLAGNSSILLQISAPCAQQPRSSFHHLNYRFQNGVTTSCKVSQLTPRTSKTDRAQRQHQAAVAAGPVWPRELSSQWWRLNSSERAAKFNSRKKWFCCYQKHVIVVSICRLFWKVTLFSSFFLAKQVLWILSCSNSQVTQLSRLRQGWTGCQFTGLLSSLLCINPLTNSPAQEEHCEKWKGHRYTHNVNKAKLSPLHLGYSAFLPLSCGVGLLVKSWHSCPRCKPTGTSSDILKWQQTNKTKKFLCQRQQSSSECMLTFMEG